MQTPSLLLSTCCSNPSIFHPNREECDWSLWIPKSTLLAYSFDIEELKSSEIRNAEKIYMLILHIIFEIYPLDMDLFDLFIYEPFHIHGKRPSRFGQTSTEKRCPSAKSRNFPLRKRENRDVHNVLRRRHWMMPQLHVNAFEGGSSWRTNRDLTKSNKHLMELLRNRHSHQWYDVNENDNVNSIYRSSKLYNSSSSFSLFHWDVSFKNEHCRIRMKTRLQEIPRHTTSHKTTTTTTTEYIVNTSTSHDWIVDSRKKRSASFKHWTHFGNHRMSICDHIKMFP